LDSATSALATVAFKASTELRTAIEVLTQELFLHKFIEESANHVGTISGGEPKR
jgi:hypothetical protein